LGPHSKVVILTHHGALCCGETIEEAFYHTQHMVKAAEAQLNILPVGLDNLIPIAEEVRKAIYDESRKPPEGTVLSPPAQIDNKEKALHQVN
jgi:adducin